MAFPIVPVVLAAAAGFGLYKGYEHFKKQNVVGPAATVSELKQGQTYAILAEFTGIGTADANAASKYLKDTFTQWGFVVLDDPGVRDVNEAAKFAQNAPSAWAFKGTWTKPGKYVEGSVPNITMATFQPIAVA
jgi:hypothetical protein